MSQKVWISSESENEEENTINIYDTESSDSYMLEILSYSLCNYWDERGLKISTNFAVTGCILCVIPHNFKDVSDHLYSDQRKKVRNLIKTFFRGLYEDELHFTLDLFWTEYTDLDNKNGMLDGD